MKLSYYGYEFEIDFDNCNIIKLNIENKNLLKEVIVDFIENLEEKEGNIILHENNTLLKPSNYIFVINNYFDIDINKTYITKYYKILNDRISYEYIEKFNDIKNMISGYIDEIVLNESFDLEYNEISNLDLLKATNLKLKKQKNILLNIIEIIKFINELTNIEIFILVNPYIYFYDDEIDELYKFILYNKLKLVIITNEYKSLNGYIDKNIFIDEDLCELF